MHAHAAPRLRHTAGCATWQIIIAMERCDGGDVFKHVCAQMQAKPPVEPDLDFVQLIFEQMLQLGNLPRGCFFFGGQQSHSTVPPRGSVSKRIARPYARLSTPLPLPPHGRNHARSTAPRLARNTGSGFSECFVPGSSRLGCLSVS